MLRMMDLASVIAYTLWRKGIADSFPTPNNLLTFAPDLPDLTSD
jgi:hypothetical protein